MGVDVLVVLGVVAVSRGGDEQGVEVDGLHAQALQVVQLLHDAHQVAAVEAAVVVAQGQRVPRGRVADVAVGVVVLPVLHVVSGIAVAKAVRQYLILHRALGPFRDVKAGDDPKGGLLRRGGHVVHPAGPPAVEVDHAPLPGHQKGIELGLFAQIDLRLVPVEGVVSPVARHPHPHHGEAPQQLHLSPGVLPDAQAHAHVVPRLGLHGLPKERRAV